jgi:hypothetical protein
MSTATATITVAVAVAVTVAVAVAMAGLTGCTGHSGVEYAGYTVNHSGYCTV